MSNLDSARVAIEAELAHAKQGAEHFLARIAALEQTLAQLVGLSGAKTGPAVSIKRTYKARATKPLKTAKGSKKTKRDDGLPFTGGDFFQNLITAAPQSAPDVLNAAIATLGFTPSKDQKKKLSNRLTFALNALVNTKKIKDSGKGRDRRFFSA